MEKEEENSMYRQKFLKLRFDNRKAMLIVTIDFDDNKMKMKTRYRLRSKKSQMI